MRLFKKLVTNFEQNLKQMYFYRIHILSTEIYVVFLLNMDKICAKGSPLAIFSKSTTEHVNCEKHYEFSYQPITYTYEVPKER